MASGLLGQATAAGVTSVVYTVPAGISHAVVHITLAQGAAFNASFYYVTVNNIAVLTVNGDTTTATENYSNSVNMMLSPGDIVRVVSPTSSITCTVSGYEVP